MKKYLMLVVTVSLLLISQLVGSIPTTLAQTNGSQTQLTPLSYQLNAINPQKLSTFYHQSIGLSILESDDTKGYYRLGLEDGTTLLEIFKADSPRGKTTGLYHTAFLFKDQQDQINAMARILRTGAPLQGTADHGVSQAIYVGDPEDNGIELYWDKPMDQWPRDNQGNIQMNNGYFETTGFIKKSDPLYESLPNTAKIGHFHLSVKDIQSTQDFYQGILGLGTTSTNNTESIFLASGNYHHHLGANTWDSLQANPATANQQGLRQVIWQTPNQSDLDFIKARLDQAGLDYQSKDGLLITHDYSGIKLSIQLIK